MTPLATKLVFFASSALGALSLGSTAYLVEHPGTFSPPPAPSLQVYTVPTMRPLPPTPVVLPEPIELEPMTVIGSKAPLIAPRHKAVPAKPAKAKEFVPCTDWRDMGPTNTKRGNESGMRRVRTLC
jgi:hypothetical protein